jgi:hypothetical protein
VEDVVMSRVLWCAWNHGKRAVEVKLKVEEESPRFRFPDKATDELFGRGITAALREANGQWLRVVVTAMVEPIDCSPGGAGGK